MKKEELSSQTLFLIDGSSFLYRAYYAIKPMHTSSGMAIQAVYGFCRMIRKLIKSFNPHYCAVIWDSPGKTERHEIFSGYKATRQTIPSDLIVQKELIKEFISTINLRQIEQPGIEADDLMYSLALDARKAGFTVVIVTSDKDMGQLLTDPQVLLFDTFKDQLIDQEALNTRYGFPPQKLSFYFALIGDSSDAIPGVAGIGPKGALALIQQFDSLEDLYAHLDRVPKERTRELLRTHREQAFMSEQLFLLRYHTLDLLPEQYAFDVSHYNHARSFFTKLEFSSLLKELTTASENTQRLTPFAEEYGYNFITILSRPLLHSLIVAMKEKRIVALDTETDGLSPLQAELVGISLCLERGTAYYLPLKHKDEHGNIRGEQLPFDEVLQELTPILEDETIKKYLHHTVYDAHIFANNGIILRGVVFDTLIAGNLVLPESQRLGLKFLSQALLNETMTTYKQVAHGYKNFSYVPFEAATDYAAADAHQTYALVTLLTRELNEQRQTQLFDTIELPLMKVLFAMEREGIICDEAVLKKIGTQVIEELAQLRNEIKQVIGKEYGEINLNSPKQLEILLFEHLKLPPVRKTAQKTGFSTDQFVLEELAKVHPIAQLIIRYRELSKLKNTYIDALPTYINPLTQRIHTHFSQTSTATGRLASSDPNMQNIPLEIRDKESIRSAFKPPPGYLFLSVDYSQIELRVLAYLSQDEHLVRAFLENRDIHSSTAAQLFDIPLTHVTPTQRQLAKRINFSILYGLTPYGLSKDLHIPLNEAKRSIEKYFAQYPGVVAWMEKVTAFAREHGYVETLWGRRRSVPGIQEKNKTVFDLAKRIAINTVAQGTAAEIMKLGMLQVYKELEMHQLSARILLQIHDELLLCVAKEHSDTTTQLVVHLLQNVVAWNVPLIVTARTGNNWQEASK
jgi:DNA polymerase I